MSQALLGGIHATKSVLGRVHNCVGKQALHCEMVASSYVHQPNYSYANFMFRLHSDLKCTIVVADVMHSVWPEPPQQGNTLQGWGSWPHSSHKIMYLYSICLASTTGCDATIAQHNLSATLTYRSYVLFLIHS